jgi:hypothetical protein
MRMKLINVNPKKINFGKNLVKASTESIAAFKENFADFLVPLSLSMPPVFIMENGSLSLVARHFSFVALVEHFDIAPIPGLLISDDELEQFVRANEIIESVMVAHAEASKKKGKNAAGTSRRERKELGYVCPFCGLLVMGPKRHRPVEQGTYQSYYRISCFSEKPRQVGCGFQAYLSSEEYSQFRRRKYPVHLWLHRTTSMCPECVKKPLFLRTRLNKKMLMCEDNFRVGGACKYRSKLSGDPPSGGEAS